MQRSFSRYRPPTATLPPSVDIPVTPSPFDAPFSFSNTIDPFASQDVFSVLEDGLGMLEMPGGGWAGGPFAPTMDDELPQWLRELGKQ